MTSFKTVTHNSEENTTLDEKKQDSQIYVMKLKLGVLRDKKDK